MPLTAENYYVAILNFIKLLEKYADDIYSILLTFFVLTHKNTSNTFKTSREFIRVSIRGN